MISDSVTDKSSEMSLNGISLLFSQLHNCLVIPYKIESDLSYK